MACALGWPIGRQQPTPAAGASARNGGQRLPAAAPQLITVGKLPPRSPVQPLPRSAPSRASSFLDLFSCRAVVPPLLTPPPPPPPRPLLVLPLYPCVVTIDPALLPADVGRCQAARRSSPQPLPRSPPLPLPLTCRCGHDPASSGGGVGAPSGGIRPRRRWRRYGPAAARRWGHPRRPPSRTVQRRRLRRCGGICGGHHAGRRRGPRGGGGGGVGDGLVPLCLVGGPGGRGVGGCPGCGAPPCGGAGGGGVGIGCGRG